MNVRYFREPSSVHRKPVASGVLPVQLGHAAESDRYYSHSSDLERALLNSTTSNPVTGAYTLLTPTDAECSVVCLDDADGTIHNDLILRVTP